jgi:hypothetical protein
MKRILFLTIIFALFLVLCLGQSKRTPIDTVKRDLSLYEQGKSYGFSWDNRETLKNELDEFKQFLWQQWSKQRRTKVTATF